jgi:hypothetical protein
MIFAAERLSGHPDYDVILRPFLRDKALSMASGLAGRSESEEVPLGFLLTCLEVRRASTSLCAICIQPA